MALLQAFGIFVEVGVIVDCGAIGGADIDGVAAGARAVQFLDHARTRRTHRGANRRHDVERLMQPRAIAARLGVGVTEVRGADIEHRDHQIVGVARLGFALRLGIERFGDRRARDGDIGGR